MVSCVKSKKRDSVLGNHSGDFVDFRTTADSCSALKSTKSTTSTTAKRSFFRKQATAVQGGGTQAGFFSNSRILEEEKQAENKKTTDIQKVDSSKQAHFLSLRALRGKAWQSIETKTQSLESTFSHNTQKIQKLQKVDSRIFHNTAIFATAKTMDCHDFANAKSRNDGNRVVDTTPQDEKTESVFDKQLAGGRIFLKKLRFARFSEKVGLCSGEQGDKTCGLSPQRDTNSPLFRKKPTPKTNKAQSPSKTPTIAIIGLGYVGLPLALTFGRQYPTIGFDINPTRINELQQKLDSSGECTLQDFLQAPLAHFSNDPKHLAQATIYLIAVPTPITHDKLPDLSYLQSACELVGSVLKVGDIVVFESTTYPTCTRTFCVPLLESTSDLELNRDFFVGYSPERINPADKAHRLSQVVKITSGSTPESAAIIDKLYASVIPAGTHCVSSIEIAEASKALENAQRDINIAFMNEAYMLFDTLGLDMAEILQAARSKWNFLPFYPGLVGGHCISVDPYYLSYIAELKGFAPQIITSSRQTNEAMPRFIASKFAKQLESAGIELQGARVLVVGFAFKKDCKDMRNTLVPNLCDELGALGLEVEVIDSLIDKEQARLEYGISVLESSQLLAHSYDGVLCNVIHSCDSAIDFQRFCKINGVFMSISLDKA